METTSQDVAEQLRDWCLELLRRENHLPCDWSSSARYIPDQGVVLCGCGVFTAAPESEPRPDAPDGELVVGGTVAYRAADPIASTLALIDPTAIYTPDELERHILDVLARLETGALFERECILKAADAAEKYEEAYQRAYHLSDATSEGKRKAEAMVACYDSGLSAAKFQADVMREAVKSTMHNLRSVLSGYQSVAKSVTATYSAGGSAGRF